MPAARIERASDDHRAIGVEAFHLGGGPDADLVATLAHAAGHVFGDLVCRLALGCVGDEDGMRHG
jgi:hypothetical protein